MVAIAKNQGSVGEKHSGDPSVVVKAKDEAKAWTLKVEAKAWTLEAKTNNRPGPFKAKAEAKAWTIETQDQGQNSLVQSQFQGQIWLTI